MRTGLCGITQCNRSDLHLKVDFGIDVDDDAGLKQVAYTGVSNHVRGDESPVKRRYAGGTALDKAINPEPCIGVTVLAQEDGFVVGPTQYLFRQCLLGLRPQGTFPTLSALTVGSTSARRMTDL